MSDGDQLFDGSGGRKYVCGSERWRFVAAAERTDLATRTLCLLLAYSGCRISEALAITPAQLDGETGRVVLRTLKRRRLSFRAVPIPSNVMRDLVSLAALTNGDAPLWRWTRPTAWRRVKAVMNAAGIRGAQAMPKGLRHGFGVAAAEKNVPAALTQRWMGHARIETTAIYQNAVGDEERSFAKRMWARPGTAPTKG